VNKDSAARLRAITINQLRNNVAAQTVQRELLELCDENLLDTILGKKISFSDSLSCENATANKNTNKTATPPTGPRAECASATKTVGMYETEGPWKGDPSFPGGC